MSIDTTDQNNNGPGVPRSVVLLFLGAMAFLGTLFFALLTVKPLSTYLSARSWVETPCKVLSSQVETKEATGTGEDRTGPTYRVAIRYSYVFNDRSYESDRYDLMEMGTGNRKENVAVVKKYPAGAEAMCYVNPGDPSESIFNRSASLKMLWGLLPLPFMVIGYWGLWGMFFRKGRDTRTTEGQVSQS